MARSAEGLWALQGAYSLPVGLIDVRLHPNSGAKGDIPRLRMCQKRHPASGWTAEFSRNIRLSACIAAHSLTSGARSESREGADADPPDDVGCHSLRPPVAVDLVDPACGLAAGDVRGFGHPS